MTSVNYITYQGKRVRSRSKKETRAVICFYYGVILLTIMVAMVAMGHSLAQKHSSIYITPDPIAAPSITDLSYHVSGDFSTPVEPSPNTELVIPEDPASVGIATTRLDVMVTGYDPTVDYSSLIQQLYGMVDDAADAEPLLALCEIYETQRNLKIEDMYGDIYETTNTFNAKNSLEDIDGIMNPHVSWMEYTMGYKYTEQDVKDFAAIIYAEAGASWVSDYHQLCTGSVVLCRLARGDWGNTIYDVVHAPGQYPSTCNNTEYDERAYNTAIYLLENGPVVQAIFQANFPQGTETVEYFEYEGHSSTWICN